MPYWRSPQSAALGVKDATIKTGVIIHHGSARNGDDYFCSMFNGLAKRFGSDHTVLLVSPKVMGEKRLTFPLYVAAGVINLANG